VLVTRLINISFFAQVIFENEAYYVTFMLILAISNGYITSIAFMFGPKVVADQQEMTAAFLVAFMLIGCSIGAVFSAPLVQLL
jgi:equilibrative nucleoside transporter 1/2/3